MNNTIWFMEGLSSQRDIIQSVKDFAKQQRQEIFVLASHRHTRNEILSLADGAFYEPLEETLRLKFIADVVKQYQVSVIHTGRNSAWFELHRQEIESLGVKLTTGATQLEQLQLADNKVAFAQAMEQCGLPAVPSIYIESINELEAHIKEPPFGETPLCIKPVKGIYGMGFWRFENQVSPMTLFNHPENRQVNPQQYLDALKAVECFEPLVLMPYLPGPEYSVDMVVEQGNVIAAVARRKEGAIQHLEISGEAYELGKACATAMKADGLVNVQTRNNHQGRPLLLEINMRPSGGIGYTQHCGINLAGIFALRQLGLMSIEEAQAQNNHFTPTKIRSITDSIVFNSTLTNLISTDNN
ncbi:carbamoyl-phosphate synthase large chain [Proteus sp. G2618]|uniref:ATP-grasp domain-containing protein n=1 Tax=Proteus TaxID=583 RepID=UPI0013784736|nr:MULTISPECIES: ATP-grasp domain-containing protein [Proteus]MCE9839981.1 ATP-grasp domain-containing protein [Proteus terrae]NBN71260.1 carbamoyl-phosphate synthase large chain [Proteus sp. G2618]